MLIFNILIYLSFLNSLTMKETSVITKDCIINIY